MDGETQAGPLWAADLNRQEHLALVSSLYGPGAVACWLAVVCSVFISWSINKKSCAHDKITNDFLGALTMPVVAAGHLTYQLIKYPGPHEAMFTTADPKLTPRSAAIEASLCICEAFSALVLPLAAMPLYRSHPRRFIATSLVGLACFVLEIVTTLRSPVSSYTITNLSRAPLIRGLPLTVITIALVFVLVVGAISTWALWEMRARQVKKVRRDQEANAIEMQLLQRQRQDAAANDDQAAMQRIEVLLQSNARKGYLLEDDYWDVVPMISELSPVLMVGIVIWSILCITPIGSSHSLAWRLTFFIPESNTSIGELDQVVALAGGLATLCFSIYDVYRSWLPRENGTDSAVAPC